jgi:hypothetical protein
MVGPKLILIFLLFACVPVSVISADELLGTVGFSKFLDVRFGAEYYFAPRWGVKADLGLSFLSDFPNTMFIFTYDLLGVFIVTNPGGTFIFKLLFGAVDGHLFTTDPPIISMVPGVSNAEEGRGVILLWSVRKPHARALPSEQAAGPDDEIDQDNPADTQLQQNSHERTGKYSECSVYRFFIFRIKEHLSCQGAYESADNDPERRENDHTGNDTDNTPYNTGFACSGFLTREDGKDVIQD